MQGKAQKIQENDDSRSAQRKDEANVFGLDIQSIALQTDGSAVGFYLPHQFFQAGGESFKSVVGFTFKKRLGFFCGLAAKGREGAPIPAGIPAGPPPVG